MEEFVGIILLVIANVEGSQGKYSILLSLWVTITPAYQPYNQFILLFNFIP